MLLLYIISKTAICSFFRMFSVKEIQSYLDPATADEMTLSDAAIIYNKYDSYLFILSYSFSKRDPVVP